MEKINLQHKYSLFNDYWSPRIVGQLNDQYVKIAKVKGEFVWHNHADEDELFLIVKGVLFIELEGKTLELHEGEMAIVPKGMEHRTRTGDEEVWIVLIEPKSTKHTGNVQDKLTRNEQEFI